MDGGEEGRPWGALAEGGAAGAVGRGGVAGEVLDEVAGFIGRGAGRHGEPGLGTDGCAEMEELVEADGYVFLEDALGAGAGALTGEGRGEEIVEGAAEVGAVIHVTKDAGMEGAEGVGDFVAEGGGVIGGGGGGEGDVVEECSGAVEVEVEADGADGCRDVVGVEVEGVVVPDGGEGDVAMEEAVDAVGSVEALECDGDVGGTGEELGAEAKGVVAVELQERAAVEAVEVAADSGTGAGGGCVDPEGLAAGSVGGEVVGLGGEGGAAVQVLPPAGFGAAGLGDADEDEIAGGETAGGVGKVEGDALRAGCGEAGEHLAGGALAKPGDEGVLGAVKEAGGPLGVLVFVGAAGGGDGLAVEDGLPGFGFEAGIAEGEVAEHLAGIVEALAAEIDAEALDVGVEDLGGNGDGGGAGFGREGFGGWLAGGEGGEKERGQEEFGVSGELAHGALLSRGCGGVAVLWRAA